MLYLEGVQFARNTVFNLNGIFTMLSHRRSFRGMWMSVVVI
jgi:hypothetical protein